MRLRNWVGCLLGIGFLLLGLLPFIGKETWLGPFAFLAFNGFRYYILAFGGFYLFIDGIGEYLHNTAFFLVRLTIAIVAALIGVLNFLYVKNVLQPHVLFASNGTTWFLFLIEGLVLLFAMLHKHEN